MKLFGLTFTYNEEAMIPYVIPYLKKMGFNKLIVYDNQSTDNTVKLLKQESFIEVRVLNTNGSKSNKAIIEKKNEVWKEFKKYTDKEDVWMFVSDFDEVIYKKDFKNELEKFSKLGYNYLNQDMFETISEKFPPLNGKLLHENVTRGNFWGCTSTGGCKMTLFKINDFETISYVPGAHRVTVKMNKEAKSLSTCGFKSFHIKYIDREYCLNRKNLAKMRRGPIDRLHGFGKQYEISDADFLNLYSNKMRTAMNISDYINGKKNGDDGSKKIITNYKTDRSLSRLITTMGYANSLNYKKIAPKIKKQNNIIRKIK